MMAASKEAEEEDDDEEETCCRRFLSLLVLVLLLSLFLGRKLERLRRLIGHLARSAAPLLVRFASCSRLHVHRTQLNDYLCSATGQQHVALELAAAAAAAEATAQKSSGRLQFRCCWSVRHNHLSASTSSVAG